MSSMGDAVRRPAPRPIHARAALALAHVDAAGPGLEIGPAYNPIAPKSAGYDVRILDHADRLSLVEKYRALGLSQAQLDAIEEIDHVWHGEPISQCVGGTGLFAWVIAAHVIEHTPDFIGFLAECSRLLAPGGVLSLVVPDKRFCFDKMRPLTSAGATVEAHLRGDSRHGPASFVDTHLYTVQRRGTGNTWDRFTGDGLELAHCRWAGVRATVDRVAGTSDYVDIHRWVFVPASFELLVHDLFHLGFVDLEVASVTRTDAFEFFVTLRKSATRPDPDADLGTPARLAMLEAIRREEAIDLTDAASVAHAPVAGRAWQRLAARVARILSPATA